MKKYALVSLFILAILTTSFGQTEKINKNIVRFGAAYAQFNGDEGFAVFNEFQFGLGKRFTVGPNLYYSKTQYNLDNKNVRNFMMGIDFNAYFAVLAAKKSSIYIGPGYTLRHVDYTNRHDYETGGMLLSEEKSGLIANLIYENRISDKWSIGLKSTWHPFGDQQSFFYAGIYGGLKF